MDHGTVLFLDRQKTGYMVPVFMRKKNMINPVKGFIKLRKTGSDLTQGDSGIDQYVGVSDFDVGGVAAGSRSQHIYFQNITSNIIIPKNRSKGPKRICRNEEDSVNK